MILPKIIEENRKINKQNNILMIKILSTGPSKELDSRQHQIDYEKHKKIIEKKKFLESLDEKQKLSRNYLPKINQKSL